MGPLFVTGATGFVGRRFLNRLPPDLPADVRCLTRHPEPPTGTARWQAVPGDLARPDTWIERLVGCETVLHLAAVTGKATPATFQAVNADGTRVLLESARQAGVRRFILVSSIAAGFTDQRHYPYAASKAQAEQAVLASELDTLIIRPTMVLGPGSPVLTGLARLATAPRGVVFGSGRLPVQPIHVDDLAELLVATLSLRPLGRQVFDAGGPEVLDLNTLIARIRKARGGTAGSLVHLPLGPIRGLLALLEPVLFGRLPFTAGQLASFANPGTAGPEPWPATLPRPKLGLDAMLSEIP
jgi:nucleoside-diphosphate-sugar epimerase